MIEERLPIVVETPGGWGLERHYVVRVLLGEFLGLPFHIVVKPEIGSQVRLRVGSSSLCLEVIDVFFQLSNSSWLRAPSLPRSPLRTWPASEDLPEASVVEPHLPVIFGEPTQSGAWITADASGIKLGLDVFGSAFFMLTRYEEMANPVRDEHGRFPSTASLAGREQFLERPIVNEYLEILWTCLKRLWPGLERKQRTACIRVSHDVDWPLTPAAGPVKTIRTAVGDVVHRKSPMTAAKRLRSYWARKRHIFDHDPHNTFKELMSISERHGLSSAFYFITDRTAGAIDGEYELDDLWIRSLMMDIHARGHEIGLHPSYGTYKDPPQIHAEFQRLLDAANQLEIEQQTWGGRQHYLRWEAPTTWQAWSDAGLDYDSTVGYADRPGFRAGTCYEYPTYNLVTRQSLALRERPLIVMEGSLLGNEYMGLDYPTALALATKLRSRCQLFQGDFTLLWHNSHFLTQRDFMTYETLLDK